MIIENVEALKSWLAKLLEPICEADPSALANYVVALVKKDKPEKDLKALCADQLDVFLQKETTGFVDKLFECLTTKNYLLNNPAKETPKDDVKPLPLKPKVVEAEPVEEERESRGRRSPQRNHESRSRDDRRREERKRRDLERHGKGGGSGGGGGDSHRERERPERRRGSPRGRSYSRSRSKSGSRGKSREREHRGGGRDFKSKYELERKDPDAFNSSSSSSHPPPLLPLPTQQQQQQQQHHPSFSSGGGGVPGPGGVAVVPAHLPDSTTDSWSSYYSNQRKDGGKPFNSNSKGGSLKQRCRDYDEKGFCVRGDLCPFDHGNDPLVVDDVTLPGMIPFPPPPVIPPPPTGIPMPPIISEPPHPLRMPAMPPHYGQPPPPGVFPMTRPPLIPTSGIETPNHQSAITSSVPIGPPGVGLPPPLPLPPRLPPPPPPPSSSVPLHPQYAQSEYNYDPEGYNPELPGLTGAGRKHYRQFIPRVQTQRTNLIGLTSGDGLSSRAANIVIKTEPAPIPIAPSGNQTSQSRFSTEQDDRKRAPGPACPSEAPPAKKPWMEKPGFNSQHKPLFPKRNHYVNTKLEVRKIPWELNNITKLNEHFSKFGTIVNIQVVFGGDPQAALIQYTHNDEARRAISSIEAVLNNRFIRVYWHREPTTASPLTPGGAAGSGAGVGGAGVGVGGGIGGAVGAQQQEQSSGPQGPILPPQHSNMHKGIKQHNPAAYVLNNTLPKHRPPPPAIKPESLPATTGDPAAPTPTPSQRSVYVPGALKSSKAKLTKVQEVFKRKQEALKLQQDMRKKMLDTKIECQKALISRLEKNRGMKPEERANIMKTLKELTDKISQLQTEMAPTAPVAPPPKAPHHTHLHPHALPHAHPNHGQPKSKIDAHKELLDAELDFHKKMSSGEDTTDLRRKLGLLQVEATRLGLFRPPTVGRGRGRGRGLSDPGAPPAGSRGRGRSREQLGRGGGALSRMSVDHRPRALSILGVTQEEKEELMPHFVKFGEVEDLRDQDATSVVMTFRTRSEAENAANQGAKFKGRVLQISWYKPKTPSVSAEPEEEEVKEEDIAEQVGHFLPGEEEEEEDEDDEDEYESRSWRR